LGGHVHVGSRLTPAPSTGKRTNTGGIRAMKRALMLILLAGCATAGRPKGDLTLHERRGDKTETATWKAGQTAIIICDMWDTHTCAGAAHRVAELAPRLNDFVKAARAGGVLIVHAPSDVIKFYEGTPERQHAKDAPLAK